MLLDLLVYTKDPGEAAYYTVRNLSSDFLRERGDDPSRFRPGEKSNALYYYKQALKYDDPELAEKWLSRYMALGGSASSIKQSIKASEPAGSLNAREKLDFLQSLDEKEKATYERAVKWYQRTYAPESEPVTFGKELDGALLKVSTDYSGNAILLRGKPKKTEKESQQEYTDRLATWQAKNDQANAWLSANKDNPLVKQAIQETLKSRRASRVLDRLTTCGWRRSSRSRSGAGYSPSRSPKPVEVPIVHHIRSRVPVSGLHVNRVRRVVIRGGVEGLRAVAVVVCGGVVRGMEVRAIVAVPCQGGTCGQEQHDSYDEVAHDITPIRKKS
jgi:hypothetical protein